MLCLDQTHQETTQIYQSWFCYYSFSRNNKNKKLFHILGNIRSYWDVCPKPPNIKLWNVLCISRMKTESLETRTKLIRSNYPDTNGSFNVVTMSKDKSLLKMYFVSRGPQKYYHADKTLGRIGPRVYRNNSWLFPIQVKERAILSILKASFGLNVIKNLLQLFILKPTL